jgi:hypothetical protein
MIFFSRSDGRIMRTKAFLPDAGRSPSGDSDGRKMPNARSKPAVWFAHQPPS